MIHQEPADIARNRRHRGLILRQVRLHGTEGLSFEGLQIRWRKAGLMTSAAVLEENVDYLVQSGFLRKQLVREDLSGVERWLVWITPQGINLLDGNIDRDPGVETIA